METVAHIVLNAIFVLAAIATCTVSLFFAMLFLYIAFAPGPRPDPTHRSSQRD